MIPSPVRRPEECAAALLIGVALVAALVLIAYQYGAGHGRGKLLPAKPWRHGVAFRLAQERSR